MNEYQMPFPHLAGAVLVAMCAAWVLSVGWYMIFGTYWAALSGVPAAWKFEPGKVVLGLGFNLLMVTGIAVVLASVRRSGVAAVALWGLIIAVLFFFPAHAGKWTWLDKPALFAIDAGGHLIALVVSGIIIGAWRGAVMK